MRLLVLLAVIASGCTGYVTYNETLQVNDTNITMKAGFASCLEACEPSRTACPDGFVAACQNTCINGTCSSCAPGCEGHDDACRNVRCDDISSACPDGSVAKCSQICYKGSCLECTPDCASIAAAAPQDPCSGMNCGPGSVICPDGYNATCTNSCSSGACSSCSPSCSGHELDHLIFSEVMYDTATSGEKDEWLELYNTLQASVSLANWTISDNSGTWKFNETYVPAKSYLVIAKNATAFQASFGCIPHVTGFSRQLNNDGDSLLLKDSSGAEQDFVAWEKGADDAYPAWTLEAEEGKSLKRLGMNDSDSAGDWSAAPPQPAC